MKDKYRVASKGKLPTLWPYVESPASDTARNIFCSADTADDAGRRIVRSQLETVLNGYNIPLYKAIIRKLCTKGTDEECDTLVLETMSEKTEGWVEAATEVQEIVDGSLRTASVAEGFEIKVEIRNPDLMYRDVSSIVRDKPAKEEFDGFEELVLEALTTIIPEDWTRLSFRMRGPTYQGGDRKPTIMIWVRPGSRQCWSETERKIEEVVCAVASEDFVACLEILSGGVAVFL